ncbi:MAG: UxaA family hydrolase, partial [Clostridia bacterium]|nr:UxaA family hydrolase [Clostridia bacterium]
MRIHPNDNVEVNIENGHKYALCDIKVGEQIIKYGFPIGVAKAEIKKGEHVHTHNIKTGLGDLLTYEYKPEITPIKKAESDSIPTFDGYVRANGDVGIRNDIWIINTVGCVNKTAQKLSELTGAFYFPHPFGCSQLGDDHELTQKILKGLINHPNAGGVLVLGLGCENNNIPAFKKVLGDVDPDRVKFLITQEASDEIAEGVKLINELKEYAKKQKKEKIPVTKLRVGLKCGGSDGYSGITANPLVGRFSDKLISFGGSTILSEVPEMFGAETILMNRAESEEIFDKTVLLINRFKEYFIAHN